ncbi:MAG TPA: energy transducer TonB [Candidatus Methylacidiphilales bacterium]
MARLPSLRRLFEFVVWLSQSRTAVMRRRFIPFWISGFIHLAIFGTAAMLFIKPAEFAMDAGHNSVEVNLVAAAPDPVAPPPPTPQPQEPVETQPPKPDDLTVPVTPPVPPTTVPPPPPTAVVQKPAVPVPPKPHHAATVAKGDGSAPKPGKDAITASSDGVAIMDVKPNYLSNPPPVYPDDSRRLKQEGVAVLEVIVNPEGHPESVSLRTSSGFQPLDQSAITAVHEWRFRPASLGSMNVRSRVIIPVRFRLDN